MQRVAQQRMLIVKPEAKVEDYRKVMAEYEMLQITHHPEYIKMKLWLKKREK